MKMELTANCQRSGNWWAIEVPELPGLFTQTRRLDQVEAMVKDAASLMLDEPQASFSVTVVPRVDEATSRAMASAKQARERLQVSQAEASAASRAAASQLAAQGLTVRDIGSVLGLSYQRAAKLLAA